MEIKFIDLVNEFYDEIKDKYEIEREHLRILLKAPFLQLKTIIEGDECEDIRIKHLGVFRIHKQSIRKLIEANDFKYKSRMITEEDYENTKNLLEKKLKEYDNSSEDL